MDVNPALSPTKLRIRTLMNRSKNNPQSQQTRNNFNLLTQTGGIMPEPNGQVAETNMTQSAAATALVEKRAQIDRFIDSILFG